MSILASRAVFWRMASAESTCQIIKDSMGDNMPWKVQVSTGSTSSDIGSEQCQEFSREGSSASGLTELDEKIHSAPCVGDATSALAIGSLSTFPTMPVTPPPGLEASVEFELASEIPSKAQPMLGSEELEHQIPSLQELVLPTSLATRPGLSDGSTRFVEYLEHVGGP